MTETTESFEQVVAQMTLINIMCRRLGAERNADGPPESVAFETSFGIAFFEDQFAIEVSEELRMKAIDEQQLLTVSATYLVVYGLPNARVLLSDNESLREQVTGFAHLAAHPYIRGSLSDLANQVGLPGVTIGLLRRGSARPDTVTILDKVFTFGEVADNSAVD